MSIHKKIKKQQQIISRSANSLALQKLKKRKAETRRKIELGGLVVKAGMDGYSKSTILGGLLHLLPIIQSDKHFQEILEAKGEAAFLDKL